jgi:hypothetical protein
VLSLIFKEIFPTASETLMPYLRCLKPLLHALNECLREDEKLNKNVHDYKSGRGSRLKQAPEENRDKKESRATVPSETSTRILERL